MQRILITGSNRGIGLDLARRYLERADTQVFTTCRNPASAAALSELASQSGDRAKVIRLDVSDSASIAAAVEAVRAEVDGLDMLVNNAGINPKTDKEMRFGALDAVAMLQVFEVNTVAPVMVAQAFADLLRQGNSPRMINVSSGAGSLERQSSGCGYTYHASKAALNMYTRCMAGTFREDGVVVIALSPGWIKTDMGGPNANLELSDSVPHIIDLIDGLSMDDTGQFYRYDGSIVPW